jgi:hypothetical protein
MHHAGLLLMGGKKMVAKIKSLVFTEVKSGFFIKERILYYDCLTPKAPQHDIAISQA